MKGVTVVGRNGSGEVDVVGCGFYASGIWTGNVDHTSPTARPGTVVTSSRASRRRSNHSSIHSFVPAL